MYICEEDKKKNEVGMEEKEEKENEDKLIEM